MVLDYKGVSFSFRSRKTRRRRQKLRLILLLVLVAVVFGGYRYWWVSGEVGEVQDLFLANRLTEAGNRLRKIEASFFLRGNIRELRALRELFNGRLEQADRQFMELQQDHTSTSLRSVQFQKLFFDRVEYSKLKLYTDYLLPRGGNENFWFYALYQAAFLNVSESEKAISKLSPDYRQANRRALELLDQVNRALRLGRIDYVFDKNDSPLAYFDIRNRSTRPLVPGIGFADFATQFKKGIRYFRLTLDAGLQRKTERLFKNYYGTLVLMDLPESSVLVAYSKPKNIAVANAAFTEQFEPGSVVKIITLLGYLRDAAKGLFPFVCPGQIILSDKVFYDWIAHRQVKDFSQALALSCNLSFARMGLAVGFNRLAGLLGRFHFNAPAFTDWFMIFQTGRFNIGVRDDFQLAELSVGLREISLTTVHAAVLAAVFSQNGLLFPPYVIEDAKNLLGLGFYSHSARPVQVLADDLNFTRVKKSMQEVVNNENGTGRRAWSAAVNLAIKTGTAGDPRQGLDAVIIGFFPVEKPRYAFAFRLEGAGKAEFNGTFFLRELLKILYRQ